MHRIRYRLSKRALDLVTSLSILLFFSPILLLVAALVRAKLGKPVLFRQERAGLYGRPFSIYKFRTMTDTRNSEGVLLSDKHRLTPFGKFLRATSLDELPQFLNVAMGQMSLVGPRPLFIRYIPRYSAHQRRRLEVMQGITGLAQVNGRNALSWEQKFDWDVHYVEQAGLLLDLWILARTALKVFNRSDISQSGHATMPEFMGSEGVSN